MKVITQSEGPAAEILAELARAKAAGELVLRVELTRDEYDALIADLEAAFSTDFRGQGPLAAFEGAALFVDGQPAAAMSRIQVPQRGPVGNGRP